MSTLRLVLFVMGDINDPSIIEPSSYDNFLVSAKFKSLLSLVLFYFEPGLSLTKPFKKLFYVSK